MKKASILVLALTMLATQSFSSVPVVDPGTPQFDIGYGVKISMEQFLKLTPKEYKKLTGHRIGLYKSIALQTIQKKLNKVPFEGKQKDQVVALLLCIFVGTLGIHRFYLGYTWQGIVQLLTLGGLGVWTLIDLIRIITGDLKPKNGEYGKTL